MKKVLGFLLVLVLLLGGIFLWKGGHHALYLADAAVEWLESDCSDQTVDISVNGTALSAETFWMEQGDDLIFGLETGGYGAYIQENVLYLDSGRAYTLPPLVPDMGQVYRLLAGAVLHGRIVKEDGVYRFQMQTQELTLSVSMTAGEELETLSLTGSFTWNGTPTEFSASMERRPSQPHSIPQAVNDAMVLAQMEPPMPLTEPLEVLVPALNGALPLSADVTLGVECGILELHESVDFSLADGQATLVRDGIRIDLALPQEFSDLSPVTAGLLLLRNGTFARTDDSATFTVTLPAEMTGQLCAALVPQLQELGITFAESEAVLTIEGEKLTGLSLTAEGSVPFLITTIPVAFTAEFEIH